MVRSLVPQEVGKPFPKPTYDWIGLARLNHGFAPRKLIAIADWGDAAKSGTAAIGAQLAYKLLGSQ
jgi:hypothetical protein